MKNITQRQIEILKIIIDEYRKKCEPIGSKIVAKIYPKTISSQTIRNEMAILEKLGYLDKIHVSSGRIPSKLGFEYYDENLTNSHLNIIIEQKLNAIFARRDSDIDNIINDSMAMLNEITSLPSVVNTYYVNESLREVSLIQLNETNAMMIIVTSLGNIYKNFISIQDQLKFDDAKVCIRLFNEYLIGTKIIDLESKIQEILPIIKQKVHQYEFITKEIVKKLFNQTFKNVRKTNVVGITSLFQYPEFHDSEILFKLINMLDTGNIWHQIRHDMDEINNVKLEIKNSTNSQQTITIASTTINLGNQKREISVVGPSRVEFGQIKGVLNYLKAKIEEIYEKNNNEK